MKMTELATMIVGVGIATAVAAPAHAVTHIWSDSRTWKGLGNSDPAGDMDKVVLRGFEYYVDQVAGREYAFVQVGFDSGSTGDSLGPFNGFFENTGHLGSLMYTYRLPYTLTIGLVHDTLEIKSTSWDVNNYHFETSATIMSAFSNSSAQSNIFVTITENASVPEPTSWAMMLCGVGAIGSIIRRRQKVRTSVSFA